MYLCSLAPLHVIPHHVWWKYINLLDISWRCTAINSILLQIILSLIHVYTKVLFVRIVLFERHMLLEELLFLIF